MLKIGFAETPLSMKFKLAQNKPDKVLTSPFQSSGSSSHACNCTPVGARAKSRECGFPWVKVRLNVFMRCFSIKSLTTRTCEDSKVKCSARVDGCAWMSRDSV